MSAFGGKADIPATTTVSPQVNRKYLSCFKALVGKINPRLMRRGLLWVLRGQKSLRFRRSTAVYRAWRPAVLQEILRMRRPGLKAVVLQRFVFPVVGCANWRFGLSQRTKSFAAGKPTANVLLRPTSLALCLYRYTCAPSSLSHRNSSDFLLHNKPSTNEQLLQFVEPLNLCCLHSPIWTSAVLQTRPQGALRPPLALFALALRHGLCPIAP